MTWIVQLNSPDLLVVFAKNHYWQISHFVVISKPSCQLISVLKVLDYDGRGKPAEYMCCNQFSLAALQEACQGSSKLELRNKIKQKKGKSYGYIYIETFNITDWQQGFSSFQS